MGRQRSRAFLTDADREVFTGERDASNQQRYDRRSLVRARLDELDDDLAILREHEPDLYLEVVVGILEALAEVDDGFARERRSDDINELVDRLVADE